LKNEKLFDILAKRFSCKGQGKRKKWLRQGKYLLFNPKSSSVNKYCERNFRFRNYFYKNTHARWSFLRSSSYLHRTEKIHKNFNKYINQVTRAQCDDNWKRFSESKMYNSKYFQPDLKFLFYFYHQTLKCNKNESFHKFMLHLFQFFKTNSIIFFFIIKLFHTVV
jgi:hypothetical protein